MIHLAILQKYLILARDSLQTIKGCVHIADDTKNASRNF